MNFIRIVKFDFLNLVRTPIFSIVNGIFPLTLFLCMGLITNSNFGGGFISSYDFYGVGTMAFVAIFISITVTNTFMEERVKKGNMRIIYAPVSRLDIYLSKLISTYIFGTILYSILSLIEQYVFNANFGGKNILYIMVLISALTFLGCSFGTLCCCIFKSEQKANAVVPLIVLIFVFFGNIFSTVGHFGTVLQKIACISPVKWTTECAYRIIYAGDFSIYLTTIAGLLVASIICIIICQIIFRPEEYV